jgi:hypothetical protein
MNGNVRAAADMSFDKNDKENRSNPCCAACLANNNDEHVCSSQLLSDSYSTLAEMANEQLNILERFSLASVHAKCQQELEAWHSAAVNHLGQIFAQRVNDVSHTYNVELLPDLKKYQDNIVQQLQTRVLPKVNAMREQSSRDTTKVQRLQVGHVNAIGRGQQSVCRLEFTVPGQT